MPNPLLNRLVVVASSPPTVFAIKSAIALAIILFCATAFADSWPAAKPSAVASPTGAVVVRIVPGTSIGEVYGFGGQPKGKRATAVYYRLSKNGAYVRYQEVSLLNPVAPVFFTVSDVGELVTLDNWHNFGIGKAIVVYRPNGDMLRSYEISEVYSKDELQKFSVSTSSVAWRCPAPPIFEPWPASIAFKDALGNVVEVNVKTGAVTKQATKMTAC